MPPLPLRSLATAIVGAVLFPATVCPAQAASPPPPDRPLRTPAALAADLASVEPEVVAWAAYDARRLGDAALVAPLRKALREPSADREDRDAPAAFVRLFLLDALAGLGAKVPATELLPWLDDARAGPVAFLLLARQPQLHEAELFALFRAGWPLPATEGRPVRGNQDAALRMQAIGNVLCAQKTPGFAAFLLDHADLDLHATVVSPGRRMVTSSANQRVFFPGPPRLPAGLPPLPVFTFLRTDRPGNTTCEWVAPGPIEVGIARRQLAQEPPVALSPARSDPAPDLAAGLPWLRALAGDRAAPATAVTVRFTGAEACARELTAARLALREFRRQLLRDLVQARALGEADAARLGAVAVQVHVIDERADQTVPLPVLPPLPVDNTR